MAEVPTDIDLLAQPSSGMGRNTLKYLGLGTAGVALLGAGIWIGSQFIDRETPLWGKTTYNDCTRDYHGPKGESEVFCYNGQAWQPVGRNPGSSDDTLSGMVRVGWQLKKTGAVHAHKR